MGKKPSHLIIGEHFFIFIIFYSLISKDYKYTKYSNESMLIYLLFESYSLKWKYRVTENTYNFYSLNIKIKRKYTLTKKEKKNRKY